MDLTFIRTHDVRRYRTVFLKHCQEIGDQVADDVRKFFGNKVFQSVIYRNVRLSEAPSFGKPVILYDAVSIGAENYIRLAEELISHEQQK